MTDAPYPLAAIRQDVECALDVWSGLLQEVLGSGLVRLYAKGSAVKAWDSPLDYVPLLSDVDLHLETSLAHGLGATPAEAFSRAEVLSGEHERRFRARRPEAVHAPRAQLVVLNDLLGAPDFVVTTHGGTRALVGALPASTDHDAVQIRALDHRQLLALDAVLADLPGALADRSGLDLWTLVRRLTWRVSPAPVRLLALVSDDPFAAWEGNRSTVAASLETAGYDALVAAWRGWYAAGWRLFETDCRDSDAMRTAIRHAYDVLAACWDAARSF